MNTLEKDFCSVWICCCDRRLVLEALCLFMMDWLSALLSLLVDETRQGSKIGRQKQMIDRWLFLSLSLKLSLTNFTYPVQREKFAAELLFYSLQSSHLGIFVKSNSYNVNFISCHEEKEAKRR